MIISCKELLARPVYNDKGFKIGVIEKYYFQPDKVKLDSILIKSGLLGSKDLINVNDIALIGNDEIVMSKNHHQIPYAKKAKEIKKRYQPLVGATAITEQRHTIGKIKDIYIDSETKSVARFFVTNLFKEIIIPIKYLVVVTEDEVVFDEDVIGPLFTQDPLPKEASAS